MTLDADAAKLLEQINAPGRRGYEDMTPTEAREAMSKMRSIGMPDPEPVDETRDLSADGPHGPIPMRMYRPKGAGNAKLPVLVYAHGGGWVLGDLPGIEPTCTRLANRSGCAVVSVDYRLAPEHKFPKPGDDAYAATKWVAANAAKLNVDADRLAVGGESAGATLSIVTCLTARDNGGPKIKYQLLIYPSVDFTLNSPSQRRFAAGHLLTNANLNWFINHYIRTPDDIHDWRAAPMNAASLAGLPPAFILTAGYDPLRDEGEAFGARLAAEAGVPVTLWRAPAQIHSFFSLGKVIPAAAAAIETAARHLKLALA
jgi:acetyl esterase